MNERRNGGKMQSLLKVPSQYISISLLRDQTTYIERIEITNCAIMTFYSSNILQIRFLRDQTQR